MDIFVNLCNFVIQPINIIPQYWASRKAAKALIDKLSQVTEENAGDEAHQVVQAVGVHLPKLLAVDGDGTAIAVVSAHEQVEGPHR